MNNDYSCSRTEHVFTNDLYITEGPNKRQSGPITEYGDFLGPILAFLGLAFKAIDDKNHVSYLDRNDFVKYIFSKANQERTEYSNARKDKQNQYNPIPRVNYKLVEQLFDNSVLHAKPGKIQDIDKSLVRYVNKDLEAQSKTISVQKRW